MHRKYEVPCRRYQLFAKPCLQDIQRGQTFLLRTFNISICKRIGARFARRFGSGRGYAVTARACAGAQEWRHDQKHQR